jgi:hypothetical protein
MTRNVRTLLLLAALFLLPLAAAFFTYYGTGWRPAAHLNHGRLLTPVRTLPALALPRVPITPGPAADSGAAPGDGAPERAFRGHWSLVYVGAGGCDAACRGALYVMRQTRLALGADMTRIARVFLVSSGCCAREFLAREHAGMEVLDAEAPDAEALLREFPARGRDHSLFIVDPRGNLLMSYDARQDPHGLLEDLKKLLRLSHIG